jgi:hypothetical protein
MPVLRVGKYCRFVERDVIEWLKKTQAMHDEKHSSGKKT